MEKEKYNGWDNYATWRINLEMVDGRDWNEEGEHAFATVSALADNIKEWCEEYLETTVDRTIQGKNLALDYALSFLADVNWYEIAQHIAKDYPKLVAETV